MCVHGCIFVSRDSHLARPASHLWAPPLLLTSPLSSSRLPSRAHVSPLELTSPLSSSRLEQVGASMAPMGPSLLLMPLVYPVVERRCERRCKLKRHE